MLSRVCVVRDHEELQAGEWVHMRVINSFVFLSCCIQWRQKLMIFFFPANRNVKFFFLMNNQNMKFS